MSDALRTPIQAARRLALQIALATFAIATLIGLVGLGPTPLGHLRDRIVQSPSISIALGTFGVFFFVLFAFATGERRALFLVALSGGAAALVQITFGANPPPDGQGLQAQILTFGLWLGAASLFAFVWTAWRGTDADKRTAAREALVACLYMVLIGACAPAFLHSTILLHPLAFDGVLYRFDATLGFQPSAVVARAAGALPPAPAVLDFVYNYTALFYAVVYGIALRQRSNPPVYLILVWALAGLGVIAYHVFPASGPVYAFGDAFPAALPAAAQVANELTLVTPAPRNAMPSLHSSWAIILWAYARLLGRSWLERACLVVLALTLAATLAKGEHYVVDLVVALPFTAATLAASLHNVPWSDARKRSLVLWGFGWWVVWIVVLRAGGLGIFEALPGLSWLALGATLWHGVRLFGRFFALAREASGASVPVAPPMVAPKGMVTATALFFVSGFTALVYEVVFSKSLGLVFGSMATATYTVLASYMGGMALGAWIGGRIAAGKRDPLRMYALCEGAIGLYCAATPLLFQLISALYVWLAAGVAPDAPELVAYRVLLGAGALLVPTVLMGMTLPAMARYFEPAGQTMGRSVAALYGANTLGAAFGALLAGYAVLPALGLTRSIAATAVASLLIALVALRLRQRALLSSAPGAAALASAVVQAKELMGAPDRRLLVLALGSLFLTGLITLALEVLYMHLLAIVAGNSVYAFSLMLFTFLLGLGGGAAVARWLLRLRQPLVVTIGWLQLGVATVVLLGVLQWEHIPTYFAAYGEYPLGLGFAPREAIRAVVCFAAMFPPALLIGAMYPLAIELATRASRAPAVAVVGRSAALNTIGNILGVLLAGFVMLPLLGSIASIRLLAAAAAGFGLLCLWSVRGHIRLRAWAPVALVVLAIAVQPRSLDYAALALGSNVYFRAQYWGEIVDHAESADGGWTSVAVSKGEGDFELRTLLTNGKFQGNDAPGGEMKAQAGFALAPLLHTPHRERALVIGYGTGGSAHTVQVAGFREVDIVELSSDILRLADRHFPGVNHGVSTRAGVRTYVTDGRNFLLLQPHTYDLISMEISSIWFAGAANLYNREFYRLAKARLATHGVLQQWIQLHHIQAQDILFVLGSIRSEFRYVWIYLIGGQGIIVATNDPQARPQPENARRLEQSQGLKEVLALYKGNLDEVRDSALIDPQGVDFFLGAFGVPAVTWVSTDDNLVLEYSTPKGNALDGAQSMQFNVSTLQKYQAQALAKAP